MQHFLPDFTLMIKFYYKLNIDKLIKKVTILLISVFLEKKIKASKNHIFYKFDKVLDFNSFEDSKFNLKIQKTSNDTYLKKNKIISEIITDDRYIRKFIKIKFIL